MEKMESGAKRDTDEQELNLQNQTKVISNQIKESIRKDNLQSLIYDLK